jgi:uncharacterized membrane protein YdbT with pleckstrin-like domain
MIHFEEGEKTIKVLRRHWFVMLPMILGNVVAAALPVIFFNIISSGSFLEWNVPSFLNSLTFEWSVFAYSIWLLWLWTLFFIEWTDYYLDFWVITDRRIIDVEQKGFFHREVTSFRYKQIQDITVETRGILETIFKFGDLQIQTAGHERKIVIKNASFPEDARSLILRAAEKERST